jgi:signal transduction histidine kinase
VVAQGLTRWFLVRGVPIRLDKNSVREWIVAAVDIDYKKRFEDEQKLSFEREKRARKLAEDASQLKDEFLANLSHELRTPLTSILGWSSIINSMELTGEEFQQGLYTIEKNSRIQMQLIDDLLDISRIITGKFRLETIPVNFNQIVESTLEIIYPAAEARNITVHKLLRPVGRYVMGDPRRLQQIVWNLLSNAVKFTPVGGEVRVEVLKEKQNVLLRVSDTGVGFSSEFHPFLFNRFSQEADVYTKECGGLGIGLSLVRNLVELHGGEVKAFSEGPGKGATFLVRLPLIQNGSCEKDPVGSEFSKEHNPGLALQGKLVFVVEDDDDTMVMLVKILERAGAVVLQSRTADQAIDLLSEQRPDIMVADIGLPLRDGIELMRDLKGLGIEIPSMALTAYVGTTEKEMALEAGYSSYLTKPIDPKQLVSAIVSLLGPVNN